MTNIANMTGGDYKVSAGTLYRSIAEMITLGFVREASEEELYPPQKDTRRKFYAITIIGREMLQSELKRMGNLIRIARE